MERTDDSVTVTKPTSVNEAELLDSLHDYMKLFFPLSTTI